MSRSWTRADTLSFCGLCRRREIKVGEPILIVKIGQGTKEHKRCQDCAGEAPPDLPELVERGPRERNPIAFTLAKDAAPKFKNRGDVKRFAERWSPHNS